MVMLQEWVETTLAAAPPDRVRTVLPLIETFYPAWVALWQDEEETEITREGLAAIKRWLVEPTAPTEELLGLSRRCEELATMVAESAHTIDGEPGAGSAHLVTALLAATLYVVAGRDDEIFASLDDVIAALPDLLESHAELEPGILRTIGA